MRLQAASSSSGFCGVGPSGAGNATVDAARSWTYQYDDLNRLISADRAQGSIQDRTYGYDDADNLTYNSGLCANNPNLEYPAPGPTAVRPHAPTSICGTAFGGRMIHWIIL